MTEQTVTIRTRDHGPVTLPEPPWCEGKHNPDGFRVDISHTGPETHLNFGNEALFTLLLTQDPYASDPARHPTLLYVEQSGYTTALDPAGLEALAAALVEHAGELRAHARQLAVIRRGETA